MQKNGQIPKILFFLSKSVGNNSFKLIIIIITNFKFNNILHHLIRLHLFFSYYYYLYFRKFQGFRKFILKLWQIVNIKFRKIYFYKFEQISLKLIASLFMKFLLNFAETDYFRNIFFKNCFKGTLKDILLFL